MGGVSILDQGTANRKFGALNLPGAYTVGRYYESGISLQHGLHGSAAMTEDRLAATAIRIGTDCTFDRIAISVTSGFGAAQGQIKLGIYRIPPNGFNGSISLVLDAGFVNVGTGTGAFEATINQRLTAGDYMLAAISNRNGGASATQPTVQSLSNNGNAEWGRHYYGITSVNFGSSTCIMGIYSAITVGTWATYTLPSTFPAITYAGTNGDVPIIGLRAA